MSAEQHAPESGDEAHHPFTMTVDLAVVESLGINLYSNAAAVLSELVANAYDADATKVTIAWKQDGQQVVVRDDGSGMGVEEINKRFLAVGYKKRDEEGARSDRYQRLFMGRKGIGKLSVFSIAETVTVYTTKDGVSHGLRIKVADLQQAISDRASYHPDPVAVPAEYGAQGTALVLTDLKTARADITARALRKRLARRFDVLDPTPADEGGFVIQVNGDPITYEDRQDLKKLEFIWEFGNPSLPVSALPSDVKRFTLASGPVKEHTAWRVGGWIGTAHQPTDLTEDKDESGSLKNVIVLARRRPIQEGILDKLDFSRLFGNYVTGQIHADFLDLDGDYGDIATSDRQRLIEDDERVVALQGFLRDAFLKASDTWGRERPKKEADDLLESFPELRRWVDERPGWQRQPAEKMLATIAGLTLEKDREREDRALLLRSGVLAFERIALREVVEDLERLGNVTAQDLLPLLGAQDVYETALWGDILRSRVEAIERFRDLTDADAKEKVLQEHLFGNLWMLDPAWERATGSERMEQDLRRVAPELFARDQEGNEITGRLDIHYATLSGRHVIVELKRYARRVTVDELAEQGMKYHQALSSLLDQQQQQRSSGDIEVIFVLGAPPAVGGTGVLSEEEFRANRFQPFNGRYRLYDAIIAAAERQYANYLEATAQVRTVNELLEALRGDTEGP